MLTEEEELSRLRAKVRCAADMRIECKSSRDRKYWDDEVKRLDEMLSRYHAWLRMGEHRG